MPVSGLGLSSDARKQLLYALRRVLRPIIRILIRAGIRFDEFAELARGVYVESAIRDGVEHPGTPTRQRIALATGVTRQQVDYYIENEGALPAAEPTLARVAVEVLHRWYTDSEYLGPDGIPCELQVEGAGQTFRSLVSNVDPSVTPGGILEELLHVGAVIHSGDEHFRPVTRSFVLSEPMSSQQMEYFGYSLTRLANTLEHNFNPGNPEKRLERFVAADRGLPQGLVPSFETFARERANHFLLDLDDWLAPYATVDLSEFGPRVNTGVNVFLFVEPPGDLTPLSSLIQPPRKPQGL
jgi:Family of unknown function (DUF6502)